MVSGLDSETATAPTELLWIWPSVTGVHVSPPSTVFQSPPPVCPAYASFGRPLTPLTAIDRPARSGPMLRHRYALAITASGDADPCAGGVACVALRGRERPAAAASAATGMSARR